MRKGIVKWFSDKKGFGFLVDSELDGDVFVHYSALSGEGYRSLKEGDEVEYELMEDQKGSRASHVVPK